MLTLTKESRTATSEIFDMSYRGRGCMLVSGSSSLLLFVLKVDDEGVVGVNEGEKPGMCIRFVKYSCYCLVVTTCVMPSMTQSGSLRGSLSPRLDHVVRAQYLSEWLDLLMLVCLLCIDHTPPSCTDM